MKTSSKIADSRIGASGGARAVALFFSVFLFCLLTMLSATGCGTVWVRPFYPRTGAHGIVVDQFDQPVTNCDMRADWLPVSWGLALLPPQKTTYFRPDKNGHWQFYMRDADFMFLGVFKYRPSGDTEWIARIGPLKSGECPTNTFVFRLNVPVPKQTEKKK